MRPFKNLSCCFEERTKYLSLVTNSNPQSPLPIPVVTLIVSVFPSPLSHSCTMSVTTLLMPEYRIVSLFFDSGLYLISSKIVLTVSICKTLPVKIVSVFLTSSLSLTGTQVQANTFPETMIKYKYKKIALKLYGFQHK